MSTIFWLPSSGAAPVSPVPAVAFWDGHVNNVSRILNSERANTALATLAYAPDAADHITDVDSMIAQFVSPVLPPQTVPAQVLGIGIRWLESNALNNLKMSMKIYAVDVPGTTELNTLYSGSQVGLEFAVGLTCEWRNPTTTARVFAVPWRLVLEVGGGGLPTAGGGRHNFSASFGDPMSSTGMLTSLTTNIGAPCLAFQYTLKCAGVPRSRVQGGM